MQSAVDHILDIRGMIVPVTLLNISQSLREIKPGETVEIVGSDPETKRDLFKILRAFPYELMNVSDEKTVYRVRLRKGSPAS
jgi:TusA-related sulfurtransferase